jgi:hypothetical protein
MALSATRLNANRFTSIYADLQAQFPIPGGLLAAEQAQCTADQQKLAHAIADNEGSDVVTEFVDNGTVPAGIALDVTSGPGAGSTGNTVAPGGIL